MDENNYKTPQADLIVESDDNQDVQLASRLQRLVASLIDTLILLVILIPMMFMLGYYTYLQEGSEAPYLYELFFALLGVVVFFVVNFKLLKDHGQTVGKRLLNIKIVTVDGQLPQLNDHLLKRYATYFLPNQIPFIGGIFGLINVLFIFRDDRRCIHDLAGNTKVVRCN